MAALVVGGRELSIPELVAKEPKEQLDYIEFLTVREYVDLLRGIDAELSKLEEWKQRVITLKQTAKAVVHANRQL